MLTSNKISRKYRILLVSSERDQKLISILDDLDYEVISRINSIEEIGKQFTSENFDVVLISSTLINNSSAVLKNISFPYVIISDDNTKTDYRNVFTQIIDEPDPEKISSTIDKVLKNRNFEKSDSWLIPVLKVLNEGVIITDSEGIITMINPFAELLTGRTQSDAIGKNVSKVFNIITNEPDLFTVDPIYQALTNFQEVSSNKIYTLISKTGNKVPIKFKITPNYNLKGSVDGFIFIIGDLSSETELSKILNEKENSYHALINSSPDAIYIYQKGKLLTVNPAWEEMFGYSQEKVVSEEFDPLQIIAPGDRFNIESIYKLQDEGKSTVSKIQIHGVSSKGKILDLEVSFSEIIWNGKRAVQGIYKDITEKRRAEGIFKLFNLAVEQSPASIVITNTSGEIKYVNPKFTQQTGYTLKEIYGLNPGIIGWADTSANEFKRLWETITAGGDWRGEFFNHRKNGETYWDIASVSSIRNEEGEITHFMAVTEDITDIKLQKERLIKAKEAAEKSDKLKSEFIAQMSHEIRTPLNNILTSIWFLREEIQPLLTEDLKEHFKIVEKNSQRFIRTIEMILNLSKIQSDTFDFKTNIIDLNEDVLMELVIEFQSRTLGNKLELIYNNRLKKSRTLADQFSVSQIFVNLIDNAIKYTPSGKIQIKLYKYSETEIAVDIKDSGIGISEDYLPNIFNPFSQEDTSNTRNYEGAGLGLALVKKYVEINNARIDVTSKKDKGTTFTVIFKEAK